jgi:hypothetical protein
VLIIQVEQKRGTPWLRDFLFHRKRKTPRLKAKVSVTYQETRLHQSMWASIAGVRLSIALLSDWDIT